jgi:2-polyprenyl-6-methoxyphenol hydroxylase-like FAD-dependent oxidoreductase
MRGVKVRVFERDASLEARDQGGTLDLRDDGGQKALFEAKLQNEFKKLARPEGQSTKILDRNGDVHFEDLGNSDDYSRPEIDRQALLNLLLNSLEPNTVIWNKHVINIESIGDGQHRLFFKDGTIETTDFLVGSDGTWSKVRPLLSSIQPIYTGVTFVENRISNPKMSSPQISELVGQGGAYVLSNNKGLMAQRNGDQSIRIYVALRVPEDWMKGFDFSQPLAIRAMLLDAFSGWKPELLEMLTRCDDNFVPRPLYARPLEQYWTTKPGLTAIGDAAHVMSPFAGEGANLAMLDALELADCLTSKECTNLTSATAALKSFEEVMINRAREAAEETLLNLNAFLSEDAPAKIAEIMKSHHRQEDSTDLVKDLEDKGAVVDAVKHEVKSTASFVHLASAEGSSPLHKREQTTDAPIAVVSAGSDEKSTDARSIHNQDARPGVGIPKEIKRSFTTSSWHNHMASMRMPHTGAVSSCGFQPARFLAPKVRLPLPRVATAVVGMAVIALAAGVGVKTCLK